MEAKKVPVFIIIVIMVISFTATVSVRGAVVRDEIAEFNVDPRLDGNYDHRINLANSSHRQYSNYEMFWEPWKEDYSISGVTATTPTPPNLMNSSDDYDNGKIHVGLSVRFDDGQVMQGSSRHWWRSPFSSSKIDGESYDIRMRIYRVNSASRANMIVDGDDVDIIDSVTPSLTFDSGEINIDEYGESSKHISERRTLEFNESNIVDYNFDYILANSPIYSHEDYYIVWTYEGTDVPQYFVSQDDVGQNGVRKTHEIFEGEKTTHNVNFDIGTNFDRGMSDHVAGVNLFGEFFEEENKYLPEFSWKRKFDGRDLEMWEYLTINIPFSMSRTEAVPVETMINFYDGNDNHLGQYSWMSEFTDFVLESVSGEDIEGALSGNLNDIRWVEITMSVYGSTEEVESYHVGGTGNAWSAEVMIHDDTEVVDDALILERKVNEVRNEEPSDGSIEVSPLTSVAIDVRSYYDNTEVMFWLGPVGESFEHVHTATIDDSEKGNWVTVETDNLELDENQDYKWTVDVVSDSPDSPLEADTYSFTTDEYFSGGSGTENDPFLISTLSDLHHVRNDLDAHYEVINDIDASATSTWNGGDGWESIGEEGSEFSGSFDGAGYTISNLYSHRQSSDNIGLFGKVQSDGFVANVHLSNIDVTGRDCAGAFAGVMNGTLENSSASGSVEGHDCVGGFVGRSSGYIDNGYFEGAVDGNGGYDVGGLVGENYGTIIVSETDAIVTGTDMVGGIVGWNHGDLIDSYSFSNVYGDFYVGGGTGYNSDHMREIFSMGTIEGREWVGGMVGQNGGPDITATIYESYTIANVEATGDWSFAGGFAGEHHTGTINQSYAGGDVVGVDMVGGFAGSNAYGTIRNCYADGNADGNELVGGFIASNLKEIYKSYSTGIPTGIEQVGGFAGSNTDTISNSFWDTETSGTDVSDGGTGKTTLEMQDIDTYTDTTTEGLDEEWDMIGTSSTSNHNHDYIWNIVDGSSYPYLSMEGATSTSSVDTNSLTSNTLTNIQDYAFEESGKATLLDSPETENSYLKDVVVDADIPSSTSAQLDIIADDEISIDLNNGANTYQVGMTGDNYYYIFDLAGDGETTPVINEFEASYHEIKDIEEDEIDFWLYDFNNNYTRDYEFSNMTHTAIIDGTTQETEYGFQIWHSLQITEGEWELIRPADFYTFETLVIEKDYGKNWRQEYLIMQHGALIASGPVGAIASYYIFTRHGDSLPSEVLIDGARRAGQVIVDWTAQLKDVVYRFANWVYEGVQWLVSELAYYGTAILNLLITLFSIGFYIVFCAVTIKLCLGMVILVREGIDPMFEYYSHFMDNIIGMSEKARSMLPVV